LIAKDIRLGARLQMNQRTFPERRQKLTPILSRYTLYGRRCSFRRREDRLRGGYVDRYGLTLLIFLILIAGLNVLDAFYDCHPRKWGHGGQSLVRWALDTCGDNVWIIKLILVSCGVIVLCLHGHFRMARVYIIVAATLYSGVVMYQLALLRYVTM
jgi:hypothetical protein